MRVWFKNERYVAGRNDASCVVAPYLVAAVKQESREPTANSDLKAGIRVTALGARADMWQSTSCGPELPCSRHHSFDPKRMSIAGLTSSQSGGL